MQPALHLQLLFMSDDTDIKGAAPKAKHPHYCIVADAEAKEVRVTSFYLYANRHASHVIPNTATCAGHRRYMRHQGLQRHRNRR